MVDDFVGNNAEGEPHVFLPLHGSVEVEVLDVGYHEARVSGRDCTVEEALGGSKFCGGRATVARSVEATAANGDTVERRF